MPLELMAFGTGASQRVRRISKMGARESCGRALKVPHPAAKAGMLSAEEVRAGELRAGIILGGTPALLCDARLLPMAPARNAAYAPARAADEITGGSATRPGSARTRANCGVLASFRADTPGSAPVNWDALASSRAARPGSMRVGGARRCGPGRRW